jgi:hypothetical protein
MPFFFAHILIYRVDPDEKKGANCQYEPRGPSTFAAGKMAKMALLSMAAVS